MLNSDQWKQFLLGGQRKAPPESAIFPYLKDKKESAYTDACEGLSRQREQMFRAGYKCSKTVLIIGVYHVTDDAPKA